MRVENKLWLTGLIEPEPDDTVGQAARCYERMDKVLSAAGASFQDVIHTMNYIDPQARVHYADTRKERERRFKGTYPASSGVIFHGMLSPPHGHLEVEATAVTDTPREPIIPPGWEEAFRDTTVVPALRKGNLVYISGQASIDHRTGASVVHKYDLVEQARHAYRNVAEICATAGIGIDDIMYTLECTPPTAQNDVRGLAQVWACQPYPATQRPWPQAASSRGCPPWRIERFPAPSLDRGPRLPLA